MVVTFDMTISREEFLRVLPAAAGCDFQEEAGGFRSADPGRPWSLRLTALPPLALGSLAMARQRVELELPAASAEEFLARFWLHFRRGGG